MEAVRRKECTNLVTIGTKASKEMLGDACWRSGVFCTNVQHAVSGEEEIAMGDVWKECESNPRHIPTPCCWGRHLCFPLWGLLSPAEPPQGSCQSGDADMHSLTRFPLLSHYFVVFIGLFEEKDALPYAARMVCDGAGGGNLFVPCTLFQE